MSSGGNLLVLIQTVTFIAGLICALLTAYLPLYAFSSDTPNSHRFEALLTFALCFVIGLPMTMTLSGSNHSSVANAISDADFYRAYVFAFSGCMLLNEVARSILNQLTGWWNDEPFVEQTAFGRAIGSIVAAIGGGTLGFYFGNGLEWAAIGWLSGIALAIYFNVEYRKNYEQFHSRLRHAPPALAPVEIDGEAVSYDPPQQPATPAYSRPSQDVASGFDVPPQR